jgi:nicotinamide phosphoribosyltransferase
MTLLDGLILKTDSYKITHWKQYPPNTQKVYSYFESRGGQYDETVFFGLTYLLEKHLRYTKLVDENVLDLYEAFIDDHFGQKGLFNKAGWIHIQREHDGMLPLRIKAVPEGSIVPTHNVLMTVENTCDKCFWLPNYVETILVQVWYPTTVATTAWRIRKNIELYLKETGDISGLNFKLHDFGFRGASSYETAMIGSMSHLLSFDGTDTLAGILGAREYYDAGMPGHSVPAAEHSTITSWGEYNESQAYENMLRQYSSGVVSIVADSYDVFYACKNLFGDVLKGLILSRDGVIVIRPDSGDPNTVVIKVLEILWDSFGGIINDKGYKVLNPHIRVIQGDGMTPQTIVTLLQRIMDYKFSADNITFGMGGGLLQHCNRDTLKFAFKCSAIQKDNEWHDVFKHPITDAGKNSKKGRMKLVNSDLIGFTTVPENDKREDELQVVYENGIIYHRENFEQIKRRVRV